MKKIFFFVFSLITSISLVSQTTFTSQNSGNWEDGNTWGMGACSPCIAGTHYPGALDNAIITNSNNVSTTQNNACTSIQIVGSGIESFTLSAGDTLDVSSTFSVLQSSSFGLMTVSFNGQLNVANSFTTSINPGSDFSTTNISIGSGGEANFNLASGNNALRVLSNTSTLSLTVDGSLNVASILQNVASAAGANITTTINGKSVISDYILFKGGSSTILCDVNDTLEIGDLTFSNSSGAASDITINMKTAGATLLLNETLNLIGGATISADPANASSFAYNGSAAQTYTGANTFEYYNLIFLNTAGVNLTADLDGSNIYNELQVLSPLTMSGYNIDLSGSIRMDDGTNFGSITANATDTINFNGTGTQRIYGAFMDYDGLVEVSNTNISGGLLLDMASDVTFSDLFINTNGVFSTDASFRITGDFTDLGVFNTVIDGFHVEFMNMSSAQNISGLTNFGDVVIQNPNGVNILSGNDSITFDDLTIESGSLLNLSDKQISLTGDLYNNSDKTAISYLTDGALRFNSSTKAQLIYGTDTTSISNIVVENSSGIVPEFSVDFSILEVFNSIEIRDGQFNFNDNVILKSDASGTAILSDLSSTADPIPFTGNITTERYLNEDDSAYWYMLGPQITNGTIGSWADDEYTTGFPGSDDPGYWFVSMSNWDEATCSYLTPSGLADDLLWGSQKSGWFMYANPDTTLDMKGTLHHGTQAINLDFTSGSGCMYGEGFNLVGNPYAAHVYVDSLNFTNVAGASGGAVYVLKNDGSGDYLTLNPDGSGHVLSSGEGFYIQAAMAGASVTFEESDKTENANQDAFNTQRIAAGILANLDITMNVNSGERVESTTIYLNDSATVGYDWFLENHDLGNENGALSISSVSDQNNLDLNAIPTDVSATRIPLEISRKYGAQNTTDNYQISFHNIELFSDLNKIVVLEDSISGTFIPIENEGQIYSFTNNDQNTRRLFLNISSPLDVTYTDPVCDDDQNGTIEVTTPGIGPYTYTWTKDGNTIREVTLNQNSDSYAVLEPGIYHIDVYDQTTQKTITTIRELKSSLEPDQIIVDTYPTTCTGTGSGKVSLSSNYSDLTYAWSNNSSLNVIDNISSGEYTVTISNSQGCSITKNAQVIDAEPLVESFTTTNNACFEDALGSASVNLTDVSDSYTYNWSNNATTSQISNLTSGLYSITVTNQNTMCEQITAVEINDPSPLLVDQIQSDVACFGEDNGSISLEISGGAAPYQLNWGNMTHQGAQVNGLTAGNYTITITDQNNCSINEQYSVTEPEDVVSSFTTDADTFSVGQEILFYNTSTGSDQHSWSFGDGNNSPLDEPTHTYASPGTYQVGLSASNSNGCNSISSQTITITNGLTSNELDVFSSLNYLLNGANLSIQGTLFSTQDISISVYNTLGQKVIKDVHLKQTNMINQELTLPNATGVYSVIISNEKETLQVKQIFK